MRAYVEIDDVLDLFGCSDWEIDAKETIREALLDNELSVITISDEQLQVMKGEN